MSRTDKDRPYRVQIMDETDGSYIDHDHRLGYCSTPPNYMTWRELRQEYEPNHNCNKVLRGVLYCSKKRPLTRNYRVTNAYFAYARNYWEKKCWSSWLAIDENGDTYHERIQCEGHQVLTREPDNPCICDDFEPYPLCGFALPDGTRPRYYSRPAPKWYRDHIWYNPERVRERDELRKAAALYNAGGWEDEDFDFDFPNNHHKHMGVWYW